MILSHPISLTHQIFLFLNNDESITCVSLNIIKDCKSLGLEGSGLPSTEKVYIGKKRFLSLVAFTF